MTVDMRIVIVWPDGTWCEANELEEVGSRNSDDFREVRVPVDMPYEETDDIASMVREGASDEEIDDEIRWWLGG